MCVCVCEREREREREAETERERDRETEPVKNKDAVYTSRNLAGYNKHIPYTQHHFIPILYNLSWHDKSHYYTKYAHFYITFVPS